jgi:hypothetical protein
MIRQKRPDRDSVSGAFEEFAFGPPAMQVELDSLAA